MYYFYDAVDGDYDDEWRSASWDEPGFGYESTPKKIRKRRAPKNIEFTMKILKGKNKTEITNIFLDKFGISSTDLETYNKAMKRVETSKHTVLIWAVPIIILSFAFFCTLFAVATTHDGVFPKIFNVKNLAFYERFTNIVYGIFLYALSIFLMIWPFTKIAKAYKWTV